MDAHTYRFIHDVDVVRKLPPGDEYVHAGQWKFIEADGHLREGLTAEPYVGDGLPSPGCGQALAVRLFGVLGNRIGAMLENLLRLTIPAPFADHAPIYYAVHTWNNRSGKPMEETHD